MSSRLVRIAVVVLVMMFMAVLKLPQLITSEPKSPSLDMSIDIDKQLREKLHIPAPKVVPSSQALAVEVQQQNPQPKTVKKHKKTQFNPAMLIVISSLEESRNALKTITSFQTRFNHQFHYDWVIVNIGQSMYGFEQDLVAVAGGNVKFLQYQSGKLTASPGRDNALTQGQNAVEFPVKFRSKSTSRNKRVTRHVLKGLFEYQDLWDMYDMYWRVPAGSTLSCDVDYDVFKYMRKNDILYGWLLVTNDYQGKQPELMSKVQQMFGDNKKISQKNLQFLLDPEEQNHNTWHYKGCSIQPEFEIVDTRLFDLEPYKKFMDMVDSQGVIFYRGWREPAIKTMGVSLLVGENQIKYFDDLAIEYTDYAAINCPLNPEIYRKNKCSCNPYMEEKLYKSLKLNKPYDVMSKHPCTQHWIYTHDLEIPPSHLGETEEFKLLFVAPKENLKDQVPSEDLIKEAELLGKGSESDNE